MTAQFIAPPPRRCTVPRCTECAQHARVVPLCLCRTVPQATCPAHPTREVPSRAQLLTVAVVCFAIAAVVLAMWLRAEAFDRSVLP